jgi:hypothetical protein
MVLAIVVPVNAVGLQIDLGKTYSFKNVNISTIDAIDLANPSTSQAVISSTVGDNSDLQTIHAPVIRQMTRDFVTTTGSINGVTVTVNGSTMSTVDWSAKPDYQIYTQPVVPTIDITVPGMTGNPIVTKYNESWNKADTSSLSGLFRSSNGIYMYKVGSAVNINATSNVYTAYYDNGIPNWKINQNDLNYTLNENAVSLGSFIGDNNPSLDMGSSHPEMQAGTGKYYASAISYNAPAKTLNVYALDPVVVLNGRTPILWTNTTSSYPGGIGNKFDYAQGSGDITLNFTGTNPDLTHIKNITYLFINDTAQYDMFVQIDTQKLAQNAQNDWQSSFTPGTHVIDLLYNGIQHDVGVPFNYSITAVGGSIPNASTQWSYIAVTPGYGISGSTTSDQITVPALNMSQLNPGLYDVYLMGTDQNNDIVALDQEQVVVGGGTPPPTNAPVLNVTVMQTSGGFLNADHIMLFNSTGWSDNTSHDNMDYANFDNLVIGNQYTVMVEKAGYLNVTANVTVTGQNPRWVNVTLAQLGQMYTPVTVLSENGTAILSIARFYQPPTGEWKTIPANKHKELLTYDLTITGNDTVGVAVEIPMRLTVNMVANGNQPITVTLDGSNVPYKFGNGIFTVDTNGYFTQNNATVQVFAPAGNSGKIIHIQFDGTVKGDGNGDGKVLANDATIALRTAARLQNVPPTYDYLDAGPPYGRFTANDATIILRNAAGIYDF